MQPLHQSICSVNFEVGSVKLGQQYSQAHQPGLRRAARWHRASYIERDHEFLV